MMDIMEGRLEPGDFSEEDGMEKSSCEHPRPPGGTEYLDLDDNSDDHMGNPLNGYADHLLEEDSLDPFDVNGPLDPDPGSPTRPLSACNERVLGVGVPEFSSPLWCPSVDSGEETENASDAQEDARLLGRGRKGEDDEDGGGLRIIYCAGNAPAMRAKTDEDVSSMFQRILITLMYSLFSASLLVVNKVAIREILSAPVVVICQLVSAALVIRGLGCFGVVDCAPLEWNRIRAFPMGPAIFTLRLYSNIKALSFSSVETVIVVQASAALLAALLDTFWLKREWSRNNSWLSLAGILVGAILYALTDSGPFSSSAVWLGVYFAAICMNTVVVKYVVSPVSVSTWTCAYYNNVLGILPTLFFGLAMQEFNHLSRTSISSIKASQASTSLVLSCMVGLGIGYWRFHARKVVSTTAFIVLGAANKIVSVLLSMAFVASHLPSISYLCLLLCIIASALFSWFTITAEETPRIEDDTTRESTIAFAQATFRGVDIRNAGKLTEAAVRKHFKHRPEDGLANGEEVGVAIEAVKERILGSLTWRSFFELLPDRDRFNMVDRDRFSMEEWTSAVLVAKAQRAQIETTTGNVTHRQGSKDANRLLTAMLGVLIVGLSIIAVPQIDPGKWRAHLRLPQDVGGAGLASINRVNVSSVYVTGARVPEAPAASPPVTGHTKVVMNVKHGLPAGFAQHYGTAPPTSFTPQQAKNYRGGMAAVTSVSQLPVKLNAPIMSTASLPGEERVGGRHHRLGYDGGQGT